MVLNIFKKSLSERGNFNPPLELALVITICQPICSQCTFSLIPKNIRKSLRFSDFFRG